MPSATVQTPKRSDMRMTQMGSSKANDRATRTSQMRVTQRGAVKTAIIAALLALWPAFAQAQTYTVAPPPFQTVLDNSGNIVNAGCVWTYAAGTSTPATTYTTSSGTANANPIIADSAGRFTAYLQPGQSYKFVYENVPCNSGSHGTVLRTADNIAAVPVSGLNVDVTGTAGEAVSAGDLLYLSDGTGSLDAGEWYKADADLYYGSIHPRLGFATASIAANGTGSIRLSGAITLSSLSVGSTYYVSGTAAGVTATAPANARSVGQALSATSLLVDISSPWILSDGEALQTMDGRLTLTTALPVTTADVTAAATFYYTPYKGNRVALFDGNRWKAYSFSELSLAITCTAANMYDIWLYDNAGTLTLDTLIWTNTTTRATALVTQNGVLSKTGALTRRYLGSFYCTSTNATTSSFANRHIWNYYNRVPLPMRNAPETADNWTYSTATVRQANANTANQLSFVIGVAEVALDARITASASNGNVGVPFQVGVGLDTTSAFTTGFQNPYSGSNAVDHPITLFAQLVAYPAVGYHFASWNEWSTATPTTTWRGDNGAATITQSGISGEIEG